MLHSNHGIIIPVPVPAQVRRFVQGEGAYLTHSTVPENTFVVDGQFVQFQPDSYEHAVVLLSKVATQTYCQPLLLELHDWAMRALAWVISRQGDKGWEKV